MNAAAPDSHSSKGPDDSQYAIQVKLTPDVLHALREAQRNGDVVSLRFDEESKTDVWTIGNQQFTCKSSREEKPQLVEVIQCSGDPAEGAPCSPVACVHKKVHFPKSTADAHLDWRQAQAAKKPEKRGAKLLDSSFNDKGVTSVKHTVRHSTAPTSKVATRPAAPKPSLAPARPVQRQVTPPRASAPRDAAEPQPRPAVKPLNPPKPRSLKPGLQKKDAAKPSQGTAPKGPVQGRPLTGSWQRTPGDGGVQPSKGSLPSPPPRPHAPPHRAPSGSGQSASPDAGTTVSSRDVMQRQAGGSSQTRSEEVKKPSPSQFTPPTSGLRLDVAVQNGRRSDGLSTSATRPDQQDTQSVDDKRTSPSPYTMQNPYTTHRDRHAARKRELSAGAAPRSESHESTSPLDRPSPSVGGSQHWHSGRPSPPTSDQRSEGVPRHHSQERSSPSSGPHIGESKAGSRPVGLEDAGYERPALQETLREHSSGSQQLVNPYSLHAKGNKPSRTPSVLTSHKVEGNSAQQERRSSPPLPSSRSSPPLPSTEQGRASERPPLSDTAPHGHASKRQSPASYGQGDDVAAQPGTLLGKRTFSVEDGELLAPLAKKPSPSVADKSHAPNDAKPSQQASPASLKRSRDDTVSPPSCTNEAAQGSQGSQPTKRLVVKLRRPSMSSTPSHGASSGGQSAVAPAHSVATPEVTMPPPPMPSIPANEVPAGRPDKGHASLRTDTADTDSHGARRARLATPHAEQQLQHVSSSPMRQDSQSLPDTPPTSRESPAKAAMAYTPDQDEDEQEYLEFVNWSNRKVSPVQSHHEYLAAKERYQHLYSLYYKLRHRSQAFMSELNALHEAAHEAQLRAQAHRGSGSPDASQAAEFRRQALELVGRRGAVFDRWQRALSNLQAEINNLKAAAGKWRGVTSRGLSHVSAHASRS